MRGDHRILLIRVIVRRLRPTPCFLFLVATSSLGNWICTNRLNILFLIVDRIFITVLLIEMLITGVLITIVIVLIRPRDVVVIKRFLGWVGFLFVVGRLIIIIGFLEL